MITDYKTKLQKQLTDSMVLERNKVNLHVREIQKKKTEVGEIKGGIGEVEVELKGVKENESDYLRLQKEYYKRL